MQPIKNTNYIEHHAIIPSHASELTYSLKRSRTSLNTPLPTPPRTNAFLTASMRWCMYPPKTMRIVVVCTRSTAKTP